MINWIEDFDDNDNTYWFGQSPYGTDPETGDGIDLFWRIKQRLVSDKIEWYSCHDSELGGEDGSTWSTPEEAKAEIQQSHDRIILQESSES